jgi:hypothetical protein
MSEIEIFRQPSSGASFRARHQLTYGSPQDRRWTINFFERFGGYYSGSLNEARVRSSYRANERLSFSLSEQWNRRWWRCRQLFCAYDQTSPFEKDTISHAPCLTVLAVPTPARPYL